VLLHLAPDRACQRAAYGLLDHQVAHVADAGAGDARLLAEPVPEDVAYGFAQAGFPDQEQRIAVVAGVEAAHGAGALDRIVLAVESAVRVDEDALLLARMIAEPLVRQAARLVEQGAAEFVLGDVAVDAAVIAEHQAVLVGLGFAPPGGLLRSGAFAADGLAVGEAAGHHAGHAERGHPGIHAVGQPVGIAENGETAGGPGITP